MKPVWLFLGRLTFLLFRPLKGIVFKHPYFQAPRVRVALKAPDGEVLVVRTWLGLLRWSLPGGGVDKSGYQEEADGRQDMGRVEQMPQLGSGGARLGSALD